MKEKDNNTNLTARQSGRDKGNLQLGYHLYSAGEDFYTMYHEERSINPEIIALTVGIIRKSGKI